MKRTDSDHWNLASSVGATATMVATARALATRNRDPLVEDRFAEPLVRAVGIQTFTSVLEGDIGIADRDGTTLLIDMVAVRTRFYDSFLTDAIQAGIRQAVILAAGLDSRAYRLPWPTDATVFELDQPDVIDFKSQALADLGASPAARRRTVGVDLRGDWRAALRAEGFDDAKPSAWIAEGLLIYLPPDAQERLIEDITTLSPPDSRFATDYHPDGGVGVARRTSSMSDQWAEQGLDLNLGDLFPGGRRQPVEDQLGQLGWQVTVRPRPEMFATYGRHFPEGEANAALRKALYVTAIRK